MSTSAATYTSLLMVIILGALMLANGECLDCEKDVPLKSSISNSLDGADSETLESRDNLPLSIVGVKRGNSNSRTHQRSLNLQGLVVGPKPHYVGKRDKTLLMANTYGGQRSRPQYLGKRTWSWQWPFPLTPKEAGKNPPTSEEEDWAVEPLYYRTMYINNRMNQLRLPIYYPYPLVRKLFNIHYSTHAITHACTHARAHAYTLAHTHTHSHTVYLHTYKHIRAVCTKAHSHTSEAFILLKGAKYIGLEVLGI